MLEICGFWGAFVFFSRVDSKAFSRILSFFSGLALEESLFDSAWLLIDSTSGLQFYLAFAQITQPTFSYIPFNYFHRF